MRIYKLVLGFLFICGSSLASATNLPDNNTRNQMHYEYLGQIVSAEDSKVLLMIISALINTQIFGLKIIEDSPMVTRESDNSSSITPNNSDIATHSVAATHPFATNASAAAASSSTSTFATTSEVSSFPVITPATLNVSAATSTHSVVTTASAVSSANPSVVTNASAAAASSASEQLSPSYFVNRDFTAEEIAALKSIDREIIASMDRVWGKIEDSKFNKEYIQSCLKVVRRTWRWHPYRIQVDLTMDEIVRCLYMPLIDDFLNGESLKSIISALELVSEKSFKTVLEIFAKLNKYDIKTWRGANRLDYEHGTNEIIGELTSKFYEVSSNDILHIAYMINCYLRIGDDRYLQGFDYFKDKNNIPEHYKFFYVYYIMPAFHSMEGLPDVVTIKFGPIAGLNDHLRMERTFVEFMRGKQSFHFYSANDISFFKELRIQLIDIKSRSTPSAQYERYALKNGEYYNISNGNKLLARRSFRASREKDDPIPKINYF